MFSVLHVQYILFIQVATFQHVLVILTWYCKNAIVRLSNNIKKASIEGWGM